MKVSVFFLILCSISKNARLDHHVLYTCDATVNRDRPLPPLRNWTNTISDVASEFANSGVAEFPRIRKFVGKVQRNCVRMSVTLLECVIWRWMFSRARTRALSLVFSRSLARPCSRSLSLLPTMTRSFRIYVILKLEIHILQPTPPPPPTVTSPLSPLIRLGDSCSPATGQPRG